MGMKQGGKVSAVNISVRRPNVAVRGLYTAMMQAPVSCQSQVYKEESVGICNAGGPGPNTAFPPLRASKIR